MLDFEIRQRQRSPKARLVRAVAHGLIVVVVALAARWAFVTGPAVLRRPAQSLDLLLYGLFAPSMPRPQTDSRVVIVGIDDATLHRLPGLAKPAYPLPRASHVRVVDELHKAGAAVVGFDIMFHDPQPGDPALAAALKRQGSAVVALEPDVYRGHGQVKQVFVPVAPALRGAATPGSVVAVTDLLGRTVALEPDQPDPARPAVHYADFAFALVTRWTGRPIEAPKTDDSGRVLLRYAGPAGTIPAVPYHEVYSGAWRKSRPATFFQGRIVLIGPTLSGIDRQQTPCGQMAGVELLAQSARMVLAGDFVRPAAPVAAVWATVILTVLLLAVLRVSGGGFVPVAAALLGGVWALVAQQTLARLGIWLPVGAPVFGLAAGAALVKGYEAFHTEVVLGRLVPRWEREWTETSRAEAPPPTRATEQRDATIVCCDLRSANAMGDSLPAAWNEALLERWRLIVENAARRAGGRLYPDGGTGMLVCFSGGKEHAGRAVRFARSVRQEAARLHSAGAAAEAGFRIGIGVATGPALEGVVRTHAGAKPEPTVTGDAAAVATQLAGMTIRLGRSILVTAATAAAAAKDAGGEFEKLGAHHVRGRQAPVEICAASVGSASASAAAPAAAVH